MPKKKSYKIDIFKIANQNVNLRNRFYYRNMEEGEEKKELTKKFYVIMRYLSGSTSPLEVQLINQLVNPYVFTNEIAKKHPELIWFLMCISTSPGRHQWLNKKKKSTPTLPIQIIKKYYGYTTKEANVSLPILSNSDIVELAEDLGIDDEELKKLKIDLRKR